MIIIRVCNLESHQTNLILQKKHCQLLAFFFDVFVFFLFFFEGGWCWCLLARRPQFIVNKNHPNVTDNFCQVWPRWSGDLSGSNLCVFGGWVLRGRVYSNCYYSIWMHLALSIVLIFLKCHWKKSMNCVIPVWCQWGLDSNRKDIRCNGVAPSVCFRMSHRILRSWGPGGYLFGFGRVWALEPSGARSDMRRWM